MEQGPEHLHAFVMVVSPSKMPAVVWSRGEDELGWLSCHNEVLRRLGGVSAVNRIGKKRRRSLFGPGRGVSSTPPIGGTPGRWGSMWTPLRPGKAPGKAKAKVRLSRLLVGCEGRRRERCRVLSDSVSSGAGTEGSRVGPGCYLAAGWSKKCASPKVVRKGSCHFAPEPIASTAVSSSSTIFTDPREMVLPERSALFPLVLWCTARCASKAEPPGPLTTDGWVYPSLGTRRGT